MKRFPPLLRIVSIFSVIGFAVGVVISFLIAPKWEAVSVIKQAQIINPALSVIRNQPPFLNVEPIVILESYDVLMNRFRAPSVMKAVLEANKLGDHLGASEKLQKDTRISNLGGAIELRVRDSTPEGAVITSEQYLIAIATEQAAFIKKSNNIISVFTPISFVINPSVSPDPITPKPLLIVLIAILVGACLGLIVSLMWHRLNV